jgi:hypothetical protein
MTYRILREYPGDTGKKKEVLATMSAFGDPDGRNVKPSMSTIAGLCGITERQVRRAVSLLRKEGVLILERAAGQRKALRPGERIYASAVYRVASNWPAKEDTQAPPQTDGERTPMPPLEARGRTYKVFEGGHTGYSRADTHVTQPLLQ